MIYDRYLALKPDDQTVRTALGASYVSAGELDKAIPIFRDVIAKKPTRGPRTTTWASRSTSKAIARRGSRR